MNDDNTIEFGLLLDSLAEVYGVALSASRKVAYWAALEDIPFADLREACDRAMRYEQFFPVPATLRKLAGYATEVLPPAEAAWQRLRNLATRYNREALGDPITREVFDAMGGSYVLEWGFGNWPMEQEDRKRREFLSRYREAHNARAIAAGQRHRTALSTKGE